MKRLFIVFLLIPSFLFAQKQGNEYIDSLLTALPGAQEDSAKVSLLNELSNRFREVDVRRAMDYGLQTLSLARKINWQRGIGNAWVSIGNVYHISSEYDSTLKYYNQALEVYGSINDERGIAQALGNIALVLGKQGKYATSLQYHFRALKINEALGNKKGIVINTGNIGIVYVNQKNYSKAIEYELKALKIAEEIGDKRSIALNMLNIGNAYLNMKQYEKALDWDLRALSIYEAIDSKRGIAMAHGNIGTVYYEQKNYTDALKYYFLSLRGFEELEEPDGVARNSGNIGHIYKNIYGDSSGIKVKSEVTSFSKAALLDSARKYYETAVRIDKELGILSDLREFAYGLSEVMEAQGNSKAALEYYKLYVSAQDAIFNKENTDLIAQLETERQLAIKQKQIELDKLAVKKKRNERIFYIIGLSGLAIVIILMARAIQQITKERQRSDQLLLNILPRSIADRLKKKEHPIADSFQNASIIFIDIANFTGFAEHRNPKDTVSMLNEIFTGFDQLAEYYGLEKIKTIGDCYMAACGLPEVRPDHVVATIRMAVAAKEMIRKFVSRDGSRIQIRIGLDCGPVVAGVIGKKKFIYDLWGDAVNTASRMESSGLVGEIHCTDRFRQMAGDDFDFTSRGTLEIKGKGKMQTWLVVTEVKEEVPA